MVVVEVNAHNTTTYQVVYTALAIVEHLGDQNQKAARAAIDTRVVEDMVKPTKSFRNVGAKLRTPGFTDCGNRTR